MNNKKHHVVVALAPTSQGMGFCVFDTTDHLLDWGTYDTRFKKTKTALEKITALIDLYHPDTIILEDPSETSSRKGKRIKALIAAITELAISEDVPVKLYTTEHVHGVIPHANKHERARDIAKVLPELEPYLPPKRHIWESPHTRMHIFDAVSLALTYFYLDT